MADAYAHGHHESVLRSHTWRTVANSASYLLPRLTTGLSLLDVGSGPGTITADFAERLAPGAVVGVDYSADVVAQAASAFNASNLSFAAADAYALEYANESFDVVHAHQVLQHVERPVEMLREMRRVAKPGGVVAARDVDYGGIVIGPDYPALAEWQRLYDAVHRGVSGEPNAGRYLKSWARAAGFSKIECTASHWLFEDEADRAWWGGMWADRVLKSKFAADALRLRLADQALLERISEAWTAWANDPDGWLLMPHAEIVATP